MSIHVVLTVMLSPQNLRYWVNMHMSHLTRHCRIYTYLYRKRTKSYQNVHTLEKATTSGNLNSATYIDNLSSHILNQTEQTLQSCGSFFCLSHDIQNNSVVIQYLLLLSQHWHTATILTGGLQEAAVSNWPFCIMLKLKFLASNISYHLSHVQNKPHSQIQKQLQHYS